MGLMVYSDEGFTTAMALLHHAKASKSKYEQSMMVNVDDS
jgi:hypothetical protein